MPHRRFDGGRRAVVKRRVFRLSAFALRCVWVRGLAVPCFRSEVRDHGDKSNTLIGKTLDEATASGHSGRQSIGSNQSIRFPELPEKLVVALNRGPPLEISKFEPHPSHSRQHRATNGILSPDPSRSQEESTNKRTSYNA